MKITAAEVREVVKVLRKADRVFRKKHMPDGNLRICVLPRYASTESKRAGGAGNVAG